MIYDGLSISTKCAPYRRQLKHHYKMQKSKIETNPLASEPVTIELSLPKNFMKRERWVESCIEDANFFRNRYGVRYDVHSPYGWGWNGSRDYVHATLAFGRRTDAGIIVLHPFDFEGTADKLYEGIENPNGMHIAWEVMPYWCKVEEVQHFLGKHKQREGSDRIVVDLEHVHMAGLPIIKTFDGYSEKGEKIVKIHLSNRCNGEPHQDIADGEIPIEVYTEIIQRVLKRSAKTQLVIEVSELDWNRPDRTLINMQTLMRLRDSLHLLE